MRIANVNIPDKKRIVIALTYIFGIGNTTSKEILKQANVDESKRVKELTDDEVNAIRDAISAMDRNIEGDLRREVLMNIRRFKEIRSYKGDRHSKHLPVRGQRTKTNNRTVRGNTRRTMGSGRGPAAQKT